MMSKLGELASLLPLVRQVLRTMVASSASRVEKLCAGVPSSSVWEATFARKKVTAQLI